MYKTEKLLANKYKEHKLEELEKIFGYCFNDKLMLVKALSHPSLKQNHDFKVYFESQKYEFEKLELLGDAVLNLAILEILISHYPRADESTLAKFKNYLVSKKIVAKVGMEINLPDFWIMSEGEKKSGGNRNIGNLENTVEALIGAIYLDSKNMLITTDLIKKKWSQNIEGLNLTVLDPKSSLQELSCAMSLGLPRYEVINQDGTANSPTFKVKVSLSNNICGEGVGKSKKEAQINAAQKLLTLLSN